MGTAISIGIRLFILFATLYTVVCVGLYYFQEKIIFFPRRLDQNYKFQFTQPFEEVSISTGNGYSVHGVLFESNRSRGLVFYLHGNSGALDSWGFVAEHYTVLSYDVFMLDYPGYGKSEGAIRSQQQLYEDIQSAYDLMKKRYDEKNITVLGYSIGTGPAAYLASTNHPGLLILQAPYYNLTDMMKHTFPGVPTFILRYRFDTNEYLRHCSMPIYIFHGTQDETIYYGSSLKLKEELNEKITLITLDGQGHNNMTDNPEYTDAIRSILK